MKKKMNKDNLTFYERIELINRKYVYKNEFSNEDSVLDNESYHIAWDNLLKDALRKEGHNDIVEKYEEAEKYFWYC